MLFLKKLYARLIGEIIMRRRRKKALEIIKGIERDEYGRWIISKDN